MSRIRSVHPGLFTDEAFVSASPEARLLFIGIWTECDDAGIFEWKPQRLKMRLRSADDGPTEPLLAELARAGCIRRFTVDGRDYGAVKNFGKWQKPKKPRFIFPSLKEIQEFTCCSVGNSAPLKEVEFGTCCPSSQASSENPSLKGGRKEGRKVGREEEVDTESSPSESVFRFPEKGIKPTARARARDPAPQPVVEPDASPEFDLGKSAALEKIPKREARYAFEGQIVRLTQAHLDAWRSSFSAIPDIVAELTTIDAKFCDQGVDRKRWFGTAAAWLRQEHERRLRQAQAPAAGDWWAGESAREASAWRSAVKHWVTDRVWPERLGLPPSAPGFQVSPTLPPDLRSELAAMLGSARAPPAEMTLADAGASA